MTPFAATRSQVQGECLRYFQEPHNARLRLVCFTWAGGGANYYRKLVGRIAPDVELIGVQLPGREDRFKETRLTCMKQIVTQVVGELRSLTDLPLVLFGHSMGALVAYEVAQALYGEPLISLLALMVSGANAPHIESGHIRCAADASDWFEGGHFYLTELHHPWVEQLNIWLRQEPPIKTKKQEV